jgi:uncharacterized protein YheU (UPF0270 family)
VERERPTAHGPGLSETSTPSIRDDAVDVPHARLARDVLRRLIEEFVTRDGTDYGAQEKTLEAKVRDVQRRLECGEAAIVYDGETDSINIVVAKPRPSKDRT